jgi:hypothetical protein
MRHFARERTETNRSGEKRCRENLNETVRTEANRNPDTALWTTLSGFESLPPSQPSLTLRVSYGWQARAEQGELRLAGSCRLPELGELPCQQTKAVAPKPAPESRSDEG